MDIEIKIGREVEGAGAMKVPSTFKRVSRRHATLYWHDGIVTIEDNESANGTFVNGRRVAKTKVKESDVVWLGGDGEEECYQLDMKKVFDSCRDAEKKARTDFSEEFEELKNVYIEYQAKVAKLKKEAATKSQLPRFIPSIIVAVISIIITVALKDYRIYAASFGSLLTTVVGFLTAGKSSDVNNNLSEQLTDLQIEYQQKYKCPKCGKDFNIATQHWKKLEAGGKCPNSKCDAMFVKK